MRGKELRDGFFEIYYYESRVSWPSQAKLTPCTRDIVPSAL